MINQRNKRIVALLPMKAHSSRVPGKNFRDFCGKPLFRWILDTLLEVEEIDQVVINTDARSLLEKHGLPNSERILVRDRKPEICGDDVSMNLVLEDDLQNTNAHVYIMTHTTNPLLKPKTIKAALTKFTEEEHICRFDSLFLANKIQSRFYTLDGKPVNHDPANLIPTQDLEPWYEENSNLYIFTQASFNASGGARIGKKPYVFESSLLEKCNLSALKR